MKIGAVFMDLSKAFVCLPHGLLIAKLHAYGLSTAACHLMFSYLKGRRQRVKISNSRSSWKLLTKGVPQGSILMMRQATKTIESGLSTLSNILPDCYKTTT